MAKGSGKRSLADTNAAKLQAVQLEPTRVLEAGERVVWDRVVNAWPADHFISSDADLLTQYCAVCLAFEEARIAKVLPDMERAGRLALSYATKLRITPQSRYNTITNGREANRGRGNSAAANRLIGGIGWQNQPDDDDTNDRPN